MKKIVAAVMLLLIHCAVFSVEIEKAMAETAVQFSKSLKQGNTIAIVGIDSENQELSNYMLDELTLNFVQLHKLKVVDRANLDAIKKEMNFQLSGEVGDDSIQQLGAKAGAQVVIRGNLKRLGDSFILVMHALNVTTAAIEDMYRTQIEVSKTLSAILSTSTRGSSSLRRSDRYYGGARAGLGFGNMLFGMGAYIAGNYFDGPFLTLWHTTNLLLFTQTITTLPVLGIPFLLSSAGAITYGFIRPKYYVKKNKNKQVSTLDGLSGFNLAFLPLENGDVAASLSYSILF